MTADELREKLKTAKQLELNKLKNQIRRMYALGKISDKQWKELEQLAASRYDAA